jgi:CheY-like chemotaxis protein
LQGSACIVSREGEGTSVYVSLPFARPETSEEHGEPVSQGRSFDRGQGKVLLADDDPVTRVFIEHLLAKRGFNVHSVDNGQKALDEVARNDYDCILMDVQMPVMDGVQTTARIRSLSSQARNTPIIALTAYAMTGDRERFLSAGMDGYISKPVDQEQLLDLLERTLSSPDSGRAGGRGLRVDG